MAKRRVDTDRFKAQAAPEASRGDRTVQEITAKHECVHLHAWETGSQATTAIGHWIAFQNQRRPHARGGQPPAVVYWNGIETDQRGQGVAQIIRKPFQGKRCSSDLGHRNARIASPAGRVVAERAAEPIVRGQPGLSPWQESPIGVSRKPGPRQALQSKDQQAVLVLHRCGPPRPAKDSITVLGGTDRHRPGRDILQMV